MATMSQTQREWLSAQMSKNRQFIQDSDDESDNGVFDEGNSSNEEEILDDIEVHYPGRRESVYEQPEYHAHAGAVPKPPSVASIPKRTNNPGPKSTNHHVISTTNVTNSKPPVAKKPPPTSDKPSTNVQSELQAIFSKSGTGTLLRKSPQLPVIQQFPTEHQLGNYDKATEVVAKAKLPPVADPGPTLPPKKRSPLPAPPIPTSRYQPPVPTAPKWSQPGSQGTVRQRPNYTTSLSESTAITPTAPNMSCFGTLPIRNQSFQQAVKQHSYPATMSRFTAASPPMPNSAPPSRPSNSSEFSSRSDFFADVRSFVTKIKEVAVVNPRPRKLRNLDLNSFPWYHGTLKRELTIDVLLRHPQDKVWLVRNYSHHQAEIPFTISIKYQSQVYHIQIRQKSTGYFALGRVKAGEDEFPTVEKLINHYRDYPVIIAPGASVDGEVISTRLGEFPVRSGFY